MPKSVLEAVKMGVWDFEPPEVDSEAFAWTEAMPGTKAKVEVLTERLRNGLPLWHPHDRFDLDQVQPIVESRKRV